MADLVDSLRKALASAGISDADLYVRSARRGSARFSLNTLNQHSESIEESATARVGVRNGDGFQLASVSTTSLEHDALVATLHRANELAKLAPTIPDWPGFAAQQGTAATPIRYAESTARCNASVRSDRLASALAHSRSNGLVAAGMFETSEYEVAVANTAGTGRYSNGTIASFKMFALDQDGNSGFAQSTHRDVERIEVEAQAREACAKSIAGKDPIALPAGEYDVVLEPPAIAELLEWMSFIAFGAREVSDGTSPLAGRSGQLVTGAAISMSDDAIDSSDLGFGIPWDRDGVLRERVVLIENGVAREPVFDRLYAARARTRSTGHAAPPGGFDDAPIAQAVRMAGGDDTLEGLTAKIQRGLHVSRFHYVNGFLDPRRALMTGLTRDGTFLIENGIRTRGVRNMRFTDSVLEALARTDGLTSIRAAVPTWWSEAGAFVAPTVLIRGFRFTGGGVALQSG